MLIEEMNILAQNEVFESSLKCAIISNRCFYIGFSLRRDCASWR